MKEITRKCILFIFLLSPFLAYSEGSSSQDQKTIFFYNPETNINNFVSLKITFDTYLSKFGDYKFQPFSDRRLFEQSIINNAKGIYLLSSWHYQYLSKKLSLKPIMVGVYNGQSLQKKILISSRGITDTSQLRNTTIASSGNEQYTRKVLSHMFGDQFQEVLETINIILVPKDIDALMAVGFGIASAALTNVRSFNNLRLINSKQFGLLKPLLESKPYFLTLASSVNFDQQNVSELFDILEKMGINREGEIRLRMLGLDGWRRLSTQEFMLLEKQRSKVHE